MTMKMRKPGKENPQNMMQRQPLTFIRHRGEFVPIETIRQHERKRDIVEREGYRVKLVEPVIRGFKVDVIAPDGRELAKDLVVRKWFSKKVRDPHEEKDIVISVHHAGGFSPYVSVNPPLVIKSPEGIPRALERLASGEETDRVWGADALRAAAGERGISISAAVPHLAKALFDSSLIVRCVSACALASAADRGTDISEAVDSLKAALQDEKKVRGNAAIALALHWQRTQDAAIMSEFAAHLDPEIRNYGKRLSELYSFEPLKEGPYR